MRTTTASGMSAIGMSIVVNLATLLGMVVFGWQAGTVFILYWIENAIIGLATLLMILTARGTVPDEITINGRPVQGRRPGLIALFFCFHYGIFCTVHLVFTVLVALKLGVDPPAVLVIPVVLLLVRWMVEVASTWFGAGERDRVSPGQVMGRPYPRIIVLHFAVIACFALFVVGSSDALAIVEPFRRLLAPLLGRFGVALDDGVVAVIILSLVKLVVDLVLTRRAVQRSGQPGATV